MEAGTWAEWIGALAAIAAAGFSVVALVLAARANQNAKEGLERDDLRERAAVARQLQAWWVKWPNDDSAAGQKPERFGIIVRNAGDGATVFRSVRIETVGNRLADASVSGAIEFQTLPPGTYRVESLGRNAHNMKPWGEKKAFANLEECTPLLDAKNWGVTKLSFTDAVGVRWQWTPETALRPLAKSPV